jgi:NADPH-dependent curcumin reductase
MLEELAPTTGKSQSDLGHAKLNLQLRLVKRPAGLFKQDDFELINTPVPELEEGKVLVRNLYLSLDPTYLVWARMESYRAIAPLGHVMWGLTVGVVEKSRHPKYREGDLVHTFSGWQKYSITDDSGWGLYHIPNHPRIPLEAFFALYGHVGSAAYYGLREIGKPQAGETVVISAAGGAVGSLVGQIAKIKGCRVVGIAGGAEKCRWITQELGFDAAIDYKSENVPEKLKQHCPNGIDVVFENVGGEILEAALDVINIKARIVLCGLISQYAADKPAPGPRNFANIGIQRARAEGILASDYPMEDCMKDISQWVLEGKIKYRVDVVDGLEQAPLAINRLFDGSHRGKLVVRVRDASE